MSLGSGGPLESGDWQARINKLAAQADTDRAARLAGHKSPFRRLLERLKPHRQEPDGDSQSNYGTSVDPGRARRDSNPQPSDP
jgi:hypothetical protein